MASNLKRATATGSIATGARRIKSVVLQGGSANSTVLIDDSAAGSGTVILALAAVIGSSAVWTAADDEGAFVTAGIFATLAGTGAGVTVEYD
jgi:hypothetical protein